jgi:hypothetical protein
VPVELRNASRLWVVVLTGLPLARTTHHVEIPNQAVPLFHRPIPIGPYTLWKYVGQVYVSEAGTITLNTGVFEPTRPLLGPWVRLYGTDAMMDLGFLAWVLLVAMT